MIGLSKYQEGQEVSAYTKKDEIFEGFVKSRDGIKYVVNSDNKAIKLSELKLVKRIGRLIKEDIEQKISDVLGEYDLAAITDAHDEDNVSKALADQLRSIDSDAQKVDNNELQSTIKSKIVGQSLEQEVEAGNIKQDDALEKYKKENSEDDNESSNDKLGESLNIKGIAPEKLFNNKKIQEKLLNEMELEFGTDAEYLQPSTNYGLGPDHREDAVEDCMDMIENGEPKEKIIDRLQTEFEIAKDVTPGGDLEYPLWVENSGNGYDIYVKVELYKSWTSDKSSEELDAAMGIIYGNAANNGWLVQYEDEEQMVLYYKYPLKATTEGEANKSTNFMDGIRFDKDMNNAYADATMTIDYTVTAVQANNSEDAMAAEWGMFPVFDSDGTLLNVYETRAEAEAARTALNN